MPTTCPQNFVDFVAMVATRDPKVPSARSGPELSLTPTVPAHMRPQSALFFWSSENVLAHVLRFRQNGLVGQADERDGAEGNRPRSGRATALLGFGQVRWTSRRRSTITMGGGRSRRRPQPEPAPAAVPLDHREFADPAIRAQVARAADAGADQHTSEAEVASCWRPRRREGATRAVEAESGGTGRVPDLGVVQNCAVRIPNHYEGDIAFLEMNGGFMRLIDSEALASWLGVEIVFVRRLVAERRIPFLKIGKFVRFDPDEVAMWIDDQRIAAVRAGPGRSGRW